MVDISACLLSISQQHVDSLVYWMTFASRLRADWPEVTMESTFNTKLPHLSVMLEVSSP